MRKIFKIIFVLFFLIFFCKNQALAQDACISGPCCSTSTTPYEFRPSDYECNSWIEYGCPWGTDYGSNIGKKTGTQYCSGDSSDCNGTISYSYWTASDFCDKDCEFCIPGNSICGSTDTPRHLFPTDGATDIEIPTSLDWCGTEEAESYHVKIYEINEEEEIFSTFITTKSITCIINFNENTTYKWRIAACSDEGGINCGDLSQKQEFTTNKKVIINPPTLSSPLPVHGALDVAIPVEFNWDDVENAESYYLSIYEEGGEWIGSKITTTPKTSVGLETLTKNTTYKWDVASCLNDNGTQCGSSCCDYERGYYCRDSSSQLTFTTGEATLSQPELINPYYDTSQPEEIPIVHPPNFVIEWEEVTGASSYLYEITDTISGITISTSVVFDDFWGILDMGTIYTWQVKPCWDNEGIDCQEESWSNEWKFKTLDTLPPTFDEEDSGPDNGAIDVLIPAKLNWDDIHDVVFYKYEVSSTSDFSNLVASGTETISEVFINYPDIKPSSDYWWRVKTCIYEENTICGPWSSIYVFTTFRLSAPCIFNGVLDENCPSPEVGGSLYTYQKNISWQAAEGAKAYKYKIDYASKDPEETDESCVAGQLISEGITTNISINVSLRCLGVYNWWLRSCLDEECTETSILTPMLTFTYVQPIPSVKFGLVPCGRITDNPKTLWNERDDCEIKHIFVLLKNIIDFVLWRVGLIALVFLVIFTAVISYFSLGGPGTIISVKSLWRTAGQGYAIMFLAWMIINTILRILGFSIKWWSLPF